MGCVADIQTKYFDALCESNALDATQLVDAALAAGTSPEAILIEVVIPAIDRINEALVVGREINLAQHYLSAKISEAMAMRLLALIPSRGEPAGRVVLGTAIGDYHGLGKKIVAGCLRAHLFEVIDVGTHVSPEAFVEAALEHNAGVIGISSMMAHTATGPQGSLGVRRVLRERGLEGRIKLMVGGAPFRFDHELYRQVEADGWGENGMDAVKTAKRLLLEVTA